jgi:drug/metabolite transporter (DMT)-like permease
MTFIFAASAAAGCAICNGVAAVLQKMGADKEKAAATLEFSLLWRLAHDTKYAIGTILDVLAGIFVLVAVHSLPLFLVQSIVASGIVVTFVIEHYITHKRPPYRLYFAIGMVLLGLVVLSLTASPDTAKPVSSAVRWIIILAPLPLAFLGALCSRISGKIGTASLAIVSGAAFGGTSVAGRILPFTPPFLRTLENPLLYAFIAYGTLGLLLFSIGLQRASATALNTMMTASQTVVPAFVGVLCFGDAVRHGLWLLGISGVAITLIGTLIISVITQHINLTEG